VLDFWRLWDSARVELNTRPRPAEVLVDGARVKVIRRRETFEEMWAGELTFPASPFKRLRALSRSSICGTPEGVP